MSVTNDYARRNHPRELHQVLPSGSTALERAIVYAYDGQPTPTVIENLSDVDVADARLLNHLAYGANVDAWSSNWNESLKRAALRNAHAIQARKGTVWAVREALKALGQGDAQIIERVAARYYDSGDQWDARLIWDDEAPDWATFAIRLRQPVTDAQGRLIIDAVSAVKPARCHLIYIDFAADLLRWDSGQKWNSGFTWDIIAA